MTRAVCHRFTPGGLLTEMPARYGREPMLKKFTALCGCCWMSAGTPTIDVAAPAAAHAVGECRRRSRDRIEVWAGTS